jgi:hypothetical protein
MKKLMFVFISIVIFEIVLPAPGGYKKLMWDYLTEEQYDGPYVQYKNNRVLVNYIIESEGTKTLKTQKVPLQQKGDLLLTVATDVPGKTFNVRLKKELQNEKSEFPKVNKLLVLSDIE